MGIRSSLDYVLNLYPLAVAQDFKGHEIAELLRSDFPNDIRSIIASHAENLGVEYLVEGSAGKGQWNHCPWLAIFDPLITTSAERGYYPVYLFREDMKGAYLSLNQGVTDIREQYKSKRKKALAVRAEDFRSRLGDPARTFPRACY
jgi:5-methylcytosine-specific restriction protein A